MIFNRQNIDAVIYEMFDGTAVYKRSFTYEELVENWEDERPVPTKTQMSAKWIELYKKIKSDSVIKIRDQRKYSSTIEYNGYTFDSDKESYELIADGTSRYADQGITTLPQPWWDTSNVDRLFTLDELRGLANAVAARVVAIMSEARTVKENINSATTLTDIDDIYNAYVNN